MDLSEWSELLSGRNEICQLSSAFQHWPAMEHSDHSLIFLLPPPTWGSSSAPAAWHSICPLGNAWGTSFHHPPSSSSSVSSYWTEWTLWVYVCCMWVRCAANTPIVIFKRCLHTQRVCQEQHQSSLLLVDWLQNLKYWKVYKTNQ